MSDGEVGSPGGGDGGSGGGSVADAVSGAVGVAVDGGLLERRGVRVGERVADRDEAVRRCGRVLVEIGAVEPSYVEAMLERERDISTYVGEGVAIPHATAAGKQAVLRDALAVVKLAEPVDWEGSAVSVCVAIAARGDGHLAILAELAEILLDPERAHALRQTSDVDEVIRLLRPAPAS